MRLLNRYIRSAAISSTGVVMMVLLAVETLMELLGQLKHIDRYQYDILKVVLYVMMQLPFDLYQLFPIAGFLGCLIGLGRLATNSELIVMRTVGVSVAQITWSVLKAAFWMILVVTIVGEVFAPGLQSYSEHMRAKAMHTGSQGLASGVWLRDGTTFFHLGSVSATKKVKNVVAFTFNDKRELTKATYAKNGKYARGHWRLFNAKVSNFGKDKVTVNKVKNLSLSLVFDPVLYKQGEKSVDQLSVKTLYQSILYREHAMLDTEQYKFTFWQRVVQPITTAVMICLGVPFVFGSLRSASTGLRVMTGVIVGFGFYMLNQFLGPLTLVYQLPPVFAALAPTLLFSLACVILLRRYL